MTKKEKIKNWCKKNKKHILTGSLIIVSCAGAAIGLSRVFKSDNIEPKVIDLNDLGILGTMLEVESRSGWEVLVHDENIKISDLGKFGERLLINAPEGISLDTGINGIFIMTDLMKTE